MIAMLKSVIQNLHRIYRHFHDYRWYFVLVFFLSLAYSLLAGFGISAFIPVFKLSRNQSPEDFSRIGRFFQRIFHWVNLEPTLTIIFVFILLMLFLRWVIFIASRYLIQFLIEDYKKSTVNRLSSKLFRSNWQYFQNQNKGSLLDFLTTRIVQVRNLFRIFARLFVSYTVALGYLMVAFWISIDLTIGAVLLSIVIVGVMIPLAGKTKNISKRSVDSQNQISRRLSEYMNAFREIKIYDVFKPVLDQIKHETDRNARASLKVGLLQKISQETIHVLVGAAIVGGIYFALSVQQIAFERIGMVSFLFLLMLRRINKMDHVQKVAKFAPSIDVLEDFSNELDREAEKHNAPSDVQPAGEMLFENKIQFDDVSFSYRSAKQHADEPVLRNINISIKKGAMISLVGKSGAGKSTLISLLLGLFEPDEGTIRVDGTALTDIGLINWRRYTGYVPQEPFLLNASIEDNITFFRDIDRETVKEAAQLSNALEFIESFPDGFDTVIGEEGVRLSGGQRQRLVFARAIAGRPSLLILDEATSELDNISERKIRESLNQLRKNMTIISVSHRLGTIIDSARIYVLEDGEIIEQGTKNELEKKQGYFTDLHRQT